MESLDCWYLTRWRCRLVLGSWRFLQESRRISNAKGCGIMWKIGLDTIGIGVLLVVLLTLMLAVLILQRQRSQKTFGIWIGSVLVGLLMGSALTLGALRLSSQGELPDATAGSPAGNQAASPGPGGGMMGGGMGGGMMGGGMGGGMMGGGMGGGMMGGGMGGPNPKRDLTTLVRKLSLLTGKIQITLTAEQAASVTTALADIETSEKMSDEDAKAKYDALMALLDDDQKSTLDAIGLPRPRGPGGFGGGMGGPGAGMSGPGAGMGGPGGSMGGPGAGMSGPGGGMGGPGGPPPQADANPFQQELNAEALKSLRQRFVPAAPAEAASESKSPTQ